jgi:hypothetical protein
MTNSLSNALPLPDSLGNRRQRSDSIAGETTPGSDEPVAWVAVAVNLAPIEAAIIKGRLESMHIPALVRQESIGAIMGLTVGPLGSAGVLVPEALAEKALAILADNGVADYGAGDKKDTNDTITDL